MIREYFNRAISKFRYFYLICFCMILIAYIDILPRAAQEYVIQITALITFIVGIPLSTGLRIDQLSQNYSSLSREFLLLVSLFVSFINVTFLLTVKYIVFGIKKSNTKVSSTSADQTTSHNSKRESSRRQGQ